MNPDPEAQGSIPVEDEEPKLDNGGGHSIFGFADNLRKIVLAKPMLLPLAKHYGFNEKNPWFRKHKHIVDKDGEDLGVQEWSFGNTSLLVYVLFIIELFIKLVIIFLYLLGLIAIFLIVLRAVELPDYVNQLWHQDYNHTQTINVKIDK